MKIVLTTDSSISAILLRKQIISALKGEDSNTTLNTWSYKQSKEKFDIAYHNLTQYTETPENNVLFRINIDGANVEFIVAWWSNNPSPSHEMQCLHVGRLVEMLLVHFSNQFTKFSIFGN